MILYRYIFLGARVPYGYQNYPQPSDWSSREPMDQYSRPAQLYGYHDRESYDGHYQPYDMRVVRDPMTPGDGDPKCNVWGHRSGPEALEQPFQQRDMRAQRTGPEELYPQMYTEGMPYILVEYALWCYGKVVLWEGGVASGVMGKE